MKPDNNFTIDVLITTYNRATPLFRNSLLSICNQTYRDFTIKVFDNGSTDNTKEVYDEIVSQYPDRKFEYKRLNENHIDDYFIEERNKLITADYVACFHDDDLIHPNYIEYAMDVIKNNPDIAVLGCKAKISYYPEQLIWDTPTKKCRIGTTKDMVKWYCVGDSFPYPSAVYKTDLFKQNKFDDGLYGNRGDFPFLMDVSKNHQVCLMETRFMHYRLHKKQTAVSLPPKYQIINVYKKMAESVLNEGEEYASSFYNRVEFTYRNQHVFSFWDALKNGWTTPEMVKKHIGYIVHCYAKYAFYSFLKHVSFGKTHAKAKKKRNEFKDKISNKPKLIYNICKNVILDKTACENVVVDWEKENFAEVKEIEVFNDKKINISISGTGNSVHIENTCVMDDVNIKIMGNNNKVIIRSEKIGKELNVLVPKSNCVIEIKDGFIEGLSVKQCEDDSFLEIGEGHTIFSGCTIYSGYADQSLEKSPKRQIIGKNVTLADNCVVLNNSSVRDGSRIAPGTTITNDV